MRHKFLFSLMAIAIAVTLAAPAGAQLTPYSQDFEDLDQPRFESLLEDGWLVFANVFGLDGNYWYGYGPFPAPNHEFGFSGIGIDDDGQFLNAYSDYNNGDHPFAFIEANVFQEQRIDAADAGTTWAFSFDARRGNINDCGGTPCDPPTTAIAFIKTLNPFTGYSLSNFITIDTTDLSDTWERYTMTIDIDASIAEHIFQIGFANTATNYQPSAVFYDNINFETVVCNDEPTVTIDGCDSGVPNADLDLCTMNDAIAACAENAMHHGQFVSCVAGLVNGWADAGLLGGPDKGKIISCAARNRMSVYQGFFSDSQGTVSDDDGVNLQMWGVGTSNSDRDSQRSPRGRK